MKILLQAVCFLYFPLIVYSQTMNVRNHDGTVSNITLSEIDSITFSFELPSEVACPGIPEVNYSGKTYHTVQIETQCWLKENLNVGTMIDSLQNPANNGIIEKYCYHNSPANCNTYGGLYAWNEAMQYVTTEGAQGICPPGWHLPTQAEFETLIAAVNNDGNALYGGGTGTNSSGFSALFAGMRHSNGSLRYLAEDAYFYSSSGRWWYGYAYSLFLYKGSSAISFYTNGLEYGFSVRCVKN